MKGLMSQYDLDVARSFGFPHANVGVVAARKDVVGVP